MSTFSFGSTATTAAKPAFGGFTTPNPQASGGTSLFGSTTQQPQPQQQQQPTTSLFGSNTQQPAQGQTQQGSSLFQPAAGAQQGGLFGQNTAPATGGLFGQQSQAPAQGQGQGQTTGGLFGSTNTSTTQPTGGLFGSTFGQNQNQNQPQTQTQTQTQGQPGGLFGSTTQSGGGLFGSTTQQPSNTSLFGSTAQQSTGGGLFGSTAQPQQNGIFSNSTNQNSNNQAGPSNFGGSLIKQEPDIETRIMAVQKAWSNESPDCRFKYFFCNVVEPGTTHLYGRPAGANDDAKWAKALRENPDPSSMVPVLATGWGDVKKRVQAQEHLASVHQQRVKEITQALSELTRQTSLSSSIRLAALQTHLTQLMHRLIHLASLTPTLIPILHSTAFRQEEGDVKRQLEGVKSELDGRVTKSGSGVGLVSKNNGKGRMIGQVNELWGVVEEIRKRRRLGLGEGGREGWLDEKSLGEVANILASQQMALQKLSDLVNGLVFDAEVIKQGVPS